MSSGGRSFGDVGLSVRAIESGTACSHEFALLPHCVCRLEFQSPRIFQLFINGVSFLSARKQALDEVVGVRGDPAASASSRSLHASHRSARAHPINCTSASKKEIYLYAVWYCCVGQLAQ